MFFGLIGEANGLELALTTSLANGRVDECLFERAVWVLGGVTGLLDKRYAPRFVVGGLLFVDLSLAGAERPT